MRALLLSLVVVLAGCSATADLALPAADGAAFVASDASIAASFDRLTEALEDAPAVTIVAEIDHHANATAAGLTLRPTRVVLFGNPALGTPLMQANPLAGLDLPQKMMIYEDAAGDVIVGYNTVDYLARRHGIGDAETVDRIERGLASFAQTAAGEGSVVARPPTATVGLREGIVTVASDADVPTTYGRLRAAIGGNSNLTIVAELDHQANAASVGMTLPPIRLIVFGNPSLGTPILQARQTVALDLPQKMLVYEDAAGDVFVAYNAPGYLDARHRLGSPAELDTIADALAALALAATSE